MDSRREKIVRNQESELKKIRKIALIGMGGTYWIGGAQYVANIVHALDSYKEIGFENHIYIFKDERQNFTSLTKLTNVIVHLVDFETAFQPWSFINRIQWFVQRKLFNRIVPRYENYFLRENFDFVFPLIMSSCNGRLRSAAWIADFQYHYFPNEASEEFTKAAYNEISQIATKAPKIVLSSRTCEKDCEIIFPQSKGRTFAMPFAVAIDKKNLDLNNFQDLCQRYEIPSDFIMVSNSFCPTKNHKTLFESLSILKKKGITIHLVCTGNIVDQRNLHFANEILTMITNLGIRNQVHLLGIIPRVDQISLYRASRAIVQPSLNEGWSTSIEEAKALGKDIIVSDIAVHQEQVENKQFMFSALEASQLASVLEAHLAFTSQRSFPEVEREKMAFEEYGKSTNQFAKRFIELIDEK